MRRYEDLNIQLMEKENNISDVEKQHALIGLSPMTEADILRTATFSKTVFFKEKYRNSLKTLTKYEMHQFRKAHPDGQLKDVLSALVKDYNPELPPSILLEMTQFIVSEWERTRQTEAVLC